MTEPILVAGQWRPADASNTFSATNPKSMQPTPGAYPVSRWSDCDVALNAAQAAFEQLRQIPRENIARFLERYADRIEANAEAICSAASDETALPIDPRLAKLELPRTTNQIRLAADACRNHSWCRPTIDTQAGIRSYHAAIGPVVVFGPNNFPLAYNGISGGDFASAIAAGNPVIAKAHPLHPTVTRLLAQLALEAVDEAGLPPATVQLIYAIDRKDGERLVADSRVGAVGFTGGRQSGLTLKAAADRAGKPIFLELSSINPVVVLDGALKNRGDEIVVELGESCLLASGQFCTSPGLVILPAGSPAEKFADALVAKFESSMVGTLLSEAGQANLSSGIEQLKAAGASVLTGDIIGGGDGFSHANTVLRISGSSFLENSNALQTEAFGNATLLVMSDSVEQTVRIVERLGGNLTGSIYSALDGGEDDAYDRVAVKLRKRVGRLLNDKMPTGVAVCSAMNHGGPYPSTGHPGFTAVGFPASVIRFSMLECFDNVRPERLPEVLQDANPGGVWRLVNGDWTPHSLR